MKKTRKLISLLMALAMIFALAIPAFAEEETTYTITINTEKSGYTYTAYQVFAGDLSEDGTTLSNVVWGDGINTSSEELLTALTEKYGTTDAAKIAELITSENEAAEFAEIVGKYVVADEGKSSTESTGGYTITGLEAGYYLVINTNVPSENGVYTDYILEVVEDVTVKPKADSVPDFEKTVGEASDNRDTSADYDVGDDVPFALTASLPASYSSYDTYKLVFTDTLSKGLELNEETITLKVNEQVMNLTAESIDVTNNDDGTTTLTVTINDLKTLYPDAREDYEVVVTYTAKLTADAEDGIVNNKASLSYSNNPNSTSEGKTTEEEVYVLTMKLVISKVDENNKDLKGAGFTLYKKGDDGTYAKVEEIEAGEIATFTFKGLATGDYKLVESTTPDGYNTIDDIYFTIDAETQQTSTGAEFKSITVKVTDEDGTEITETEGNETFTANAATATISSTIVNQAGSELPSTGGMGTTLFYIFGGALVLCAVVLLVTRRRMDNEQ